MKNAIKAVRLAVREKTKEEAVNELNRAKSIIARTARKGIVHRKTAARKISRLSRVINTVT
jgi:small subunit ribosomal protein S20